MASAQKKLKGNDPRPPNGDTLTIIDKKKLARIEAEHAEHHRSSNEQTQKDAAEIRKQVRPDGRYTIHEAIILLLDANNGKSIPLIHAISEGRLRCYPPGSTIPIAFDDVKTYGCDNRNEVYWDDLNKWLEEKHKRVNFKFPDPHATSGAPEQAGDDAPRSPLILTPPRTNEKNYKRCEELGLEMPTELNSNGTANMPRGLSKAAKDIGMSRQALTESVTKHIAQLEKKKQQVIVR